MGQWSGILEWSSGVVEWFSEAQNLVKFAFVELPYSIAPISKPKIWSSFL